MDVRQLRLIEDLAGIFRGEIFCHPLAQSIYASDGSLHQETPLGVAFPHDRDDVQTLVRYAAEQKLPLIPRGAGTSVAGEALGAGIIVDFSRHMHAVEEVGQQTVRVQPGVVLSRLNHVLRESGRYFPPDPANSDTTTIGSMLALDAAGSHSIRVGSTRDHVNSIELVTANGVRFEAGNEPLPTHERFTEESNVDEATKWKSHLLERIEGLLVRNAKLILEKQPERQVRNRAGYLLRGVLTDSGIVLPRLLVGSEGTLGLFTAATLRTSALPAWRSALLIGFETLDSAIQAVQPIAVLQPSACDLIDRRLLSMARDLDARFASLIPANAEAALIVEMTGFSHPEAAGGIRDVQLVIKDLPDPGRMLYEATTFDEVEFLWSLPGAVIPLLNRARGETSPVPLVEDIAVPPEMLLEFIARSRRIWQKHELTASLYAHAAVGQVHMRPFLRSPLDPLLLEDLARDLYHAAISVGGSISGEHGLGYSRTAFLPSQYGELYRVFQQLKSLFDPDRLLNPDKILSDDPHLTVNHLRPEIKPTSTPIELQLNWSAGELGATVTACHGCGGCRTQEPNSRMCPFFRRETSEARTPRAKANALRAIVDGRLAAHELASSDMRRLSDFCFNCKQCELECPTEVNIPHLMLEAKAQYVAANGPRMSEWFLSRVHGWSESLCRMAWFINPLIANRTVRWLLERGLGVARQRKLPAFAHKTFLSSAPREWLAPPVSLRDPIPVVYFVDHYANAHDPELAFALGRILEHQGFRIHVPASQHRSGMAHISIGDVETARQLATDNIRLLAEFAREGCPIICTEPAAALCLKVEYPRLLDHPDVQLVADHVVEAGHFLADLQARGDMRTDFQSLPLTAAYHTPCHLRALGKGTPLLQICRLIPQLVITDTDHGCSGMAGTFGLSRENFEESLAIGHDLIEQMRSDQIEFGMTECSSCKFQMEQQSPTPTLHPLKVLALAYGLMPEIRKRLRPNLKKLVTS